jgi:hypothetical protein
VQYCSSSGDSPSDSTLIAAHSSSGSVANGNGDVTVECSFGTVGSDAAVPADSGCGGSSADDGVDPVVEELSRKYGGYLRARRAATVIQQTYRQYSMSRSFAKLRLEAGESRRSRRFGRRKPIGGSSNSDEQELNKESSSGDEMTPLESVRNRDDAAVAAAAGHTLGLDCRVEDALNTAAAILMQQTSPLDDAAGDIDDGRLSEHGGECSSSRSLSPLPPPMDPVATAGGDLPSVCFETMLDDIGVGGSAVFCGHSQRTSRLNTVSAADFQPPGVFPSPIGNAAPPSSSSQSGRSNYVIGIPRDSGARKYFEFPHLPVLGSGSQSQFVAVNGSQQYAVVHHQPNNCNSCGVPASYGHHHAQTSVHCQHRKYVGPMCGVGADSANGAPVGFPCSHSASGVSNFNSAAVGHSESSPIWKRKSGSVESCDGNVCGGGFVMAAADDDFRRRERPWSDVYPGSTTSSEDAGSIGSGSNNEVAPVPSHHHHYAYYRPGVECLNGGSDVRVSSSATYNSSSANTAAHNSASDRQRKRSYRIGLNLFNKYVVHRNNAFIYCI